MLRVSALMGVFAMATMVMADPPAAAPASDLDKLQGYWKPLQCDYEGKAQMPTDLMKQVTVVFDKSEYHLYFKDSKTDKDNKPIVFRLAQATVAYRSLDENDHAGVRGRPAEGEEEPRHLRAGREPTEGVLRLGGQAEADQVRVARRQRVLQRDVDAAGEVTRRPSGAYN